MKRDNELLVLEEASWRSAGDRERYAEHLSADAIHVFPKWGLAERDAVLAGVADADAWQSFTIEDPQALAVGEDAVALVYRACARRRGEQLYVAAITSVYRRRDGAWELVLHQQTPLDEP